MKYILGRLRRCVEDYNMIEEGDRIAVGISGGKDSLTALLAMKKLQSFYNKNFYLEAITIDMGFDNMDFSEVKRKPYFYLALICMLLTGMSLNGMGEISSLHMYDIGMSKEFVASLATVSSLLLMSSKFLNGFMYDRIGIKKTMNLCYACAFISLGLLALLSNTPIGKVLASIKPIFSATALPLETVMISLFANELFGNKSFNKVVGMFAASTTAGFALASPFSQLWKSVFGNYTVSMIAFAILMIFVTVTMQFVLKCANRDKKTILEALEREEVTE